ncbi:PAS domain-containing protein [Leptolyngbya sp. CCNP1308]|uniref:PAS domain-containing protein n=1 Tax=Leptolyngbya sp. CCNP1308 TaxID=3110255 RepID=UPI002B20200E|nr:PAS domain-containing protein [Leptolyngbya sp. CCNP1308]MEA5452987.1 PAS domain-containing protein [Leptolyngbya sp. CCNP1308]
MTAQRQAQRALQEQTATLQSFYNSSPLMMGVVELSDHDILHVSDNQGTATFFNTTVEALEGRWASELGVAPDHIQAWVVHYRQSQTLGQPVQFDYAHTTDTTTTWLSVVVSYIGLGDSQRPRFSYVAADISDRKQAEADLRASEARCQFALEGPGDGVWDWNLQTNALFLSRQWKAMLGYGEDEIGNSLDEWSSRVHPDDLEQCYAILQRHLNGETPIYRDEYRICCKDGGYKWVLDRGKVVEWTETGEPLRAIGTISDISDRKQMELALKAKNQELDQFFSVNLFC